MISQIAGSLLLALLVHYLVSSYHTRGLNRYPGPLLARYTKLWHLLDVWTNKHEVHLIELHKRYGDVVRIGPNELSISRPDYVPRIYGLSPGYLKSDMYDVFGRQVNGKRLASWLSVRDPQHHAAIKQPIAGHYILSTVLTYEHLVDDVIRSLVARLDEDSAGQASCSWDLALLFRFYAYDTITHLTFGQNIGMLRQRDSTHSFLIQSDKTLNKVALLATMPWTADIFKFNRLVEYLSKGKDTKPSFAENQIEQRMRKEEASSAKEPKDYLDRFVAASRIDDSDKYNHNLLKEWTLVSIGAGADTTAIALCATVYFLLRHPPCVTKLMTELLAADLSYPVSWKESQRLPYLDACIKEAFRLHPVIGLGLGRVGSGLEMPDGYALPAGVNVSINAWVVHRQPLFGDRVESFVPERWLQQETEEDGEYKARMNAWKRADLFFGGNGSRGCTGRHIALMEIYKVVPTILLKFQIQLRDPSHEWHTTNRWTVRQEQVECVLTPRSSQ